MRIGGHRLAEVVANKLRLEEEGQQAEGMSQQLSESAQAMRNSSALQQMASQINRAPQQVLLPLLCFLLLLAGVLYYTVAADISIA